jgi:hypothetical protein
MRRVLDDLYQFGYACRPARIATRSIAGGSRLEKQPTDRRRKACYFRSRTLARNQCWVQMAYRIRGTSPKLQNRNTYADWNRWTGENGREYGSPLDAGEA